MLQEKAHKPPNYIFQSCSILRIPFYQGYQSETLWWYIAWLAARASGAVKQDLKQKNKKKLRIIKLHSQLWLETLKFQI